MVTQHSPAEHMQVRRNLLELAGRGFEVDVVCSADTGVQEVTDLPAGVRVFEVPVRHRRRPAIRYPFEYTAGDAMSRTGLLGGPPSIEPMRSEPAPARWSAFMPLAGTSSRCRRNATEWSILTTPPRQIS